MNLGDNEAFSKWMGLREAVKEAQKIMGSSDWWPKETTRRSLYASTTAKGLEDVD